MKRMIESVSEFCSVTGMKLTCSTCKWLSYAMSDGRRVVSSELLNINDEEIKPIAVDDCLKYLGALIVTNRGA